MTSTSSADDGLLDRAAALRAERLTPKQIARALGLRPAVLTPLVRQLATRAAAAEQDAVVVCWVSPGWSSGLTVAGHPDWLDTPADEAGESGLATVVVARRHRPRRVAVCGYLIDTHCLGVKDALGPRVMNDSELPAFRGMFFAPFEHLGPPLPAPLQLARHLVYGAVDAARGWGFEPGGDFTAAAGHLGDWHERSAITFGRDGMPCYMQGPYDDAAAVLATLRRTVGEGNFHYFIQADAAVLV